MHPSHLTSYFNRAMEVSGRIFPGMWSSAATFSSRSSSSVNSATASAAAAMDSGSQVEGSSHLMIQR